MGDIRSLPLFYDIQDFLFYELWNTNVIRKWFKPVSEMVYQKKTKFIRVPLFNENSSNLVR